MTSQLLTRIDTDLKNRFKARAQEQGLSMDFLVNIMIKAYTEKPESVKIYVDDDTFDQMLEKAWTNPDLKPAFASLDNTLRQK
jgi:antitoxin component of RelBE/YafQ-DinJ toxin-antitoxin module